MIIRYNCLSYNKLLRFYILLVFFLIAILNNNSYAKSRFRINNLPQETIVIANGKKIQPDSLGYFIVSKGLNTIQIECKGIVKYSASLSLKDDENDDVQLNCQEACSSIDIVSDPLGATVRIDGDFVGITPYFSSFIKPGEYSVKLSLRGYESISRRISLSPDKPSIMTLNLEPSKAFSDSILIVKKAKKKSRQFVQKIIFTGLTAVLSGSAIYFEMKARHRLSEADKNAADYDLAKSDFNTYRTDYYENRDQARKALAIRDMFYFAAGASAVGFGFSFLF